MLQIPLTMYRFPPRLYANVYGIAAHLQRCHTIIRTILHEQGRTHLSGPLCRTQRSAAPLWGPSCGRSGLGTAQAHTACTQKRSAAATTCKVCRDKVGWTHTYCTQRILSEGSHAEESSCWQTKPGQMQSSGLKPPQHGKGNYRQQRLRG